MDRGWIDELISKLNIVEVISKYVPLKKKGRTHWGCCPFHHEKEPSFAVNEDKQFYHCFGCKESGNVITFIQKIESVEFWDAVNILAKEANFKIPETDFKKRDNGIEREKRDRLLSLMRAAGRHYYENLSKEEAAPAREYIKRREISDSLVRKFALGYSVDGQEIINYLKSQGYTLDEMKEVGIVEVSASGPYDVFNKRLMIPIVNHVGEVVAFGGRLLNPSTHVAVKYRNSSNTPVFDKSRTLFALNLVKKKKQREGIKYIIIAEGYMDVMMLHKAGFDTAIASMGTALTFQQAKLIRNYCNTVYISYDGDSAGQKATLRGLDILKEAGLNVKVVMLPDELDPDDLIKQRGAAAYQKLIDEALTLTEYKLVHAAKSYDLATPDGKSGYAIEALQVISKLDNPVEKEEYLRVVMEKTGYAKGTLMKQLGLSDAKNEEEKSKKRVHDEQEQRKADEEKAPLDKRALFVIASLAHNKEYADVNADVYPYLKDEFLKRVYEYVIDCRKKGEMSNPSSLFTLFGEESDALAVVNYEFLEGDNQAKFNKCVSAVKSEWLKGEQKRIMAEFEKTRNVELLKEVQKLNEKLQQLKKGGTDEY